MQIGTPRENVCDHPLIIHASYNSRNAPYDILPLDFYYIEYGKQSSISILTIIIS